MGYCRLLLSAQVISTKRMYNYCIYMYIHSVIFMTNKSVMTFLYVNKYLPIYNAGPRLSVVHTFGRND